MKTENNRNNSETNHALVLQAIHSFIEKKLPKGYSILAPELNRSIETKTIYTSTVFGPGGSYAYRYLGSINYAPEYIQLNLLTYNNSQAESELLCNRYRKPSKHSGYTSTLHHTTLDINDPDLLDKITIELTTRLKDE